MSGRTWVLVGSLSAGIAVALGALAAHGLEGWLADNFPASAEKRLANWKTGVTYQMYHSLGLILIGLVVRTRFSESSLSCSIAAVLMLLGIGLFSGMLYGWVLLDVRAMVLLVPIGGICLIAGWVMLAWSVFRP